MTQNQIRFQELQESRRSNLANEEIKRESNRITQSHYQGDEAIRSRSNDISAEANLITQGHYQRMDSETVRSNKAKEKLTSEQNKIASRNADTNALNAETNKGNLKVNQQLANIRGYEAETGRMNVAVNQQNANTNLLNAQENIRHNKTNEIETHRTNVVNEQLTAQRNTAQTQYWVDSIQNDAYINSANAAHKQAEISEIGKESSRRDKQTKAEVELKESQTDLNKAKKAESITKSVDQGTNALTRVSEEVRKWLRPSSNSNAIMNGGY